MIVTTDKPKIMMMNRTNTKRIEADEKEIADLLEQQKGEPKEESDKDKKSEEPELAPEEKTFKNRYADLRRHAQKKEEDLQKQINELKVIVEAKPTEAPEGREEVEAWVKQYPDVANIVQTLASETYEERAQSLEKRFTDIEERDAKLSLQEMNHVIKETHADYEDLKNSDDFHDWASVQSKFIQDALYENSDDPHAVVRVIDLYKQDTFEPPEKKVKEPSAADEVDTRENTPGISDKSTKGAISESQVDKMTSKEFEKNSDAIEEAIRTGKFIYDMSQR